MSQELRVRSAPSRQDESYLLETKFAQGTALIATKVAQMLNRDFWTLQLSVTNIVVEFGDLGDVKPELDVTDG